MFKSVDHALRFAFKHLSSDIVKMSSINSMRGSSGNGDLTPHDRHAQAAMIIAACERSLDQYEQAVTLCGYGDAGHVADQLVPAVIATLGTGMHSTRGVKQLVLSYFGRTIGAAAMRANFKTTDYRVREYKKLAYDALDGICYRANAKLHAEFSRCGILDQDELKNVA